MLKIVVAEDKELVEEVFTNAIDVLNKDDQKLPQVENLLPLLKRGIGIHHGGKAGCYHHKLFDGGILYLPC